MAQIDFGSDKIARNIAQTAFPMLVAQVLSLLYSIVDRVYIGRIPGQGTDALGGIGLCFPVIMIIHGFTNMFGMGGSPIFAMERGRKNSVKAGQVMNTSFRLTLITALLITVLGEILAGPLLTAFGAGERTFGYAIGYLRIYLIGTVSYMLSTGMNPFINAQGFPRTGMLTVTIGAAANLILDPLFIFALGMGVSGAALATILSQTLSALFAIRFLTGPKTEIRLTSPLPHRAGGKDGRRRDAGRNGDALRHRDTVRDRDAGGYGDTDRYLPFAGDICSLGLAPFIMQCTNSLVQIVCNSTLVRWGGEVYVSVMTIVASVRQIMDTPTQAVTEGSSPIISYNYGAGNPGNVRKTVALMTAVGVGYTLVVWSFVLMSPGMFIGIFTRDAAMTELAVPALHLYFFAFVFQAFQFSGQTVFKALGKKKRTIFFSLFRKVVMVVPLTILLPHIAGLGTDGVFMAEPISNFVGGAACYTTMLLTILPELRKMEDKKRAVPEEGGL